MQYRHRRHDLSVLRNLRKGSVTRGELMTFITLLNPFAPHLTEEINEVLGNRGNAGAGQVAGVRPR